jgi:hypothetical protein
VCFSTSIQHLNNMKNQFIALLIIFILTACSNEKNKIKVVKEVDNGITKVNLYQKIEALLEQKIAFDDVTISYSDLIKSFSKPFNTRFQKDGGSIMKELLPKWKAQSMQLISDLKIGNEITLTNKRLNLDRQDKELNAYSCRVNFDSKNIENQLNIRLLEVDKQFYIVSIDK